MKVIDGNQAKAQECKARKRRSTVFDPASHRQRRAGPGQLTKALRAVIDAGCTPRGALLGADGSIKIELGKDGAQTEISSWDELIDGHH